MQNYVNAPAGPGLPAANRAGWDIARHVRFTAAKRILKGIRRSSESLGGCKGGNKSHLFAVTQSLPDAASSTPRRLPVSVLLVPVGPGGSSQCPTAPADPSCPGPSTLHLSPQLCSRGPHVASGSLLSPSPAARGLTLALLSCRPACPLGPLGFPRPSPCSKPCSAPALP